jgi:hypothetical protein
MLKTLTATAALAFVLAGTSHADVRLEGNLEFTKKTKECPSNIKLNVQWRSRYHAGNTLAPGNNDWTGINRVEDFFAQAWGRGGDFTTSYQKVSNGSLTDRFTGVNGDNDISTSKSSLKLLALPATIDGSTKEVIIKGKIKNPLGKSTQAKCVVDFTGIYQNRDFLLP